MNISKKHRKQAAYSCGSNPFDANTVEYAWKTLRDLIYHGKIVNKRHSYRYHYQKGIHYESTKQYGLLY